jgi:hypothetical protein
MPLVSQAWRNKCQGTATVFDRSIVSVAYPERSASCGNRDELANSAAFSRMLVTMEIDRLSMRGIEGREQGVNVPPQTKPSLAILIDRWFYLKGIGENQ